jgi:hypothetical protein
LTALSRFEFVFSFFLFCLIFLNDVSPTIVNITFLVHFLVLYV